MSSRSSKVAATLPVTQTTLNSPVHRPDTQTPSYMLQCPSSSQWAPKRITWLEGQEDHSRESMDSAGAVSKAMEDAYIAFQQTETQPQMAQFLEQVTGCSWSSNPEYRQSTGVTTTASPHLGAPASTTPHMANEGLTSWVKFQPNVRGCRVSPFRPKSREKPSNG